MIRLDVSKTLGRGDGAFDIEVALQIERGSLVALYGPSGAGKTSLLRMLAGLLRPDRGEIWVDGQYWFRQSPRLHWPPQRRGIGLVFQDYALFPHWTARDNLRFALPRGEDPAIVENLLRRMDLWELRDRKPARLSGGQQQRLALARALVPRPKILLLDEPLSALEEGLREELQTYLAEVHRSFGLTTLLVSHDRREVRRLADRVVRMERGRIVAEGTAAELMGERDLVLWGVVRTREGDTYEVRVGVNSLRVHSEAGEGPRVGERVRVAWRSGRWVWLD